MVRNRRVSSRPKTRLARLARFVNVQGNRETLVQCKGRTDSEDSTFR